MNDNLKKISNEIYNLTIIFNQTQKAPFCDIPDLLKSFNNLAVLTLTKY